VEIWWLPAHQGGCRVLPHWMTNPKAEEENERLAIGDD